MFISDMPDVPPQYASVMIAQAEQARSNNAPAERIVGICQTVLNDGKSFPSLANTIDPRVTAQDYFYKYEHKKTVTGSATITILQPPKHGVLRLVTEADFGFIDGIMGGPIDPAAGLYVYLPEKGYLGKDSATVLVDIGGIKVKVKYSFQSYNGNSRSDWEQELCKKGYSWKISATLDASGNSTLTAVDYLPSITGDAVDVVTDTTALASTLGPNFQSRFVADTSGVTLNVADLLNAAVAQTTGEGKAATITLDTNAAGHGWFIDPTPAANDEFLPTSNPNEWIAKIGTEAAGKMDMLSVLLHEYGHALGFEHSTNSHDFMATTLTPGVRRLPTPDELALMAQLVGEIKGDVIAGTNTPDSPQSPFPTLPLDSILGLALFGRLRSTRYGGVMTAIDSAKLIQYDIAANPTFTNSQLQYPAGWATTGNVSIATGDAVLTESATTQTRLNQVFIVGPADRFLSFTLAGINLDDQSAAPDDAFEAALLDANTGLSLLGSTGLTHNDAFLNLQADGSEHKASGITSIHNADNSRTYLVDLAGIAAGTAVNLSFDLLGFGTGAASTNSHLTIRNLSLSTPTTNDDAVALSEDTPTVIAVQSNDTLPVGAGDTPFATRLVATPSHGQAVVNADGSFNYTPDANYYGTDSFSYQVVNGLFASNVATVNLTIAAVNDAPVANELAITIAEDGSGLIAQSALASDIDSAALTTSIVTAPLHGQVVINADGSFAYTPVANYNGTDSFSYRVNDGELDSNVATVSLTITAVNDAPIASDASFTLAEGSSGRIDLVALASDVDNPTLNAVIVNAPMHGSLTQNNNLGHERFNDTD